MVITVSLIFLILATVERFELSTYGLEDRYSSAELYRHNGAESRIRTHGGFHLSCFQDSHLKPLGHLRIDGEDGEIRTLDLPIKSRMLYQLSYILNLHIYYNM